ncbi:MAG: hypothetical protein FWF12_06685 [Betaproteobacteria bacterium]|nr:hypothetical protein [Betaproteobacteria bacterium]
MPLFSSLPENALPGDRARRRGALYLLLAPIATLIAIPLFLNLYPLWASVISLDGIAFVLVATLFGAIASIAPIASIAGWLLALWYGVESVFMARERRTPTTDIIITSIGLVAWFLPALGLLALAVLTSRDPLQAPNAYWQEIGYKLTGAGVLAWLAWRYWRGKLRRKTDM